MADAAEWVFWAIFLLIQSPIVSLPILLHLNWPILTTILVITVLETLKVTPLVFGFQFGSKKLRQRWATKKAFATNNNHLIDLKQKADVLTKKIEGSLRYLSDGWLGLIIVAAFPSLGCINLGPIKIALITTATRSVSKSLLIVFLGDLLFIFVYALLIQGGLTLTVTLSPVSAL